jgi:hypothetical protein
MRSAELFVPLYVGADQCYWAFCVLPVAHVNGDVSTATLSLSDSQLVSCELQHSDGLLADYSHSTVLAFIQNTWRICEVDHLRGNISSNATQNTSQNMRTVKNGTESYGSPKHYLYLCGEMICSPYMTMIATEQLQTSKWLVSNELKQKSRCKDRGIACLRCSHQMAEWLKKMKFAKNLPHILPTLSAQNWPYGGPLQNRDKPWNKQTTERRVGEPLDGSNGSSQTLYWL